MKFTQIAILMTGVLSSFVLAAPEQRIELILDGADTPAQVDAYVEDNFEVETSANDDPVWAMRYTTECPPHRFHDIRCTANSRHGCRCDSRGTYLCNPPSLRRGNCHDCGCRRV